MRFAPGHEDEHGKFRVHVECADCDRTGMFLCDLGGEEDIKRELEKDPWRCLYHDLDWRWHTERSDRVVAQVNAGTRA